MKRRPDVIEEPKLEFGGHGREIDIRLGLSLHGPLEPERASQVRLGVIGTSDTIEGFERWLERCRAGIDAKPSRQPNLFMRFPGLENENPFRCKFEIDASARRAIPRSDIDRICKIQSTTKAVKEAVDLFAEQVESLALASPPPDVILCALPVDLLTRVVNHEVTEGDDEQAPSDEGGPPPDFRDLLKARTLHHRRSLQLIWPTTWDDDAKIARKLEKLSGRRVQDPATRAWNLFNALYYKAGHVPWRLPRDPAQLATSYVGITFFKEADGSRLLSSTAQLFDERGQGLVLRGGRAKADKFDRHPYLERAEAYDLLLRSLKAYHAHHYHWPARVVLYKSSQFKDDEADGFQEALNEAGVRFCDFIWVWENSPFRLMRTGDYPPLRGTHLELEQGLLLYMRGSVPYFRTYPGLYVPNPLMLRPYKSDATLEQIGRETLALGKVNWNTTQFDGSLPITLRGAREVGKVLKHLPADAGREAAEYRLYT